MVHRDKDDLPVVKPLALVLEAVGPLADPEAAALVVLPLAHVRLGHVRVKHLVLERKSFKQIGRKIFSQDY